MRENQLPECQCPYCEAKLDTATDLKTNVMPKPGDISVCINCAQVLVFADDLTLRKPQPGEITMTPEIELYQKAVRGLDRRRH